MDGALVGVWRIRNRPKGYEKSHTEKGFFERIEQIYESVAGYPISGAGVPEIGRCSSPNLHSERNEDGNLCCHLF
jgi:hypothetical protein